MSRRRGKDKLAGIRKTLFKYQSKKCAYCDTVLTRDKATLDHVVPLALGGSKFKLENLVVTCKPCNHRKDSRDPEPYIQILKGKKYKWLKLSSNPSSKNL